MAKKLPKWIPASRGSKEWKKMRAKDKALMRRVAARFVPGPGLSRRVYQSGHGFCRRPIWFYTTGLGPCIGLCIMWNGWAGIAHSDWVDIDECDDIAAVVNRAKNVIPADVSHLVHPVICGADIAMETSDPEPEETLANTLRLRARTVELLRDARFGEPYVRWNQLNETTNLVAHVGRREIYIDNGSCIVARWSIRL